jgi:hypothetical protein
LEIITIAMAIAGVFKKILGVRGAMVWGIYPHIPQDG